MPETVLSAAAAAGFQFAPYRATAGGSMYPLRADAKTLLHRLGLTNPFTYYCRIASWLKRDVRFDVRQMRDAAEPLERDRVKVHLRHDMDTEPYSSVEVAGALHNEGLTGSFYVLHTAEYYGQWSEGTFLRNDGIVPMLRTIQDDFDCEIGLHTDGLWVYQQWGADGSQAVVSELAWLRQQRIRITGTAAHNSAPVYGAENFEMFRGRSVRSRCHSSDGTEVPLQTLDEPALGLEYEANAPELEPDGPSRLDAWSQDAADPIRDPQWMRTYLLDHPICRWGADFNLWLIGRDRWAIAGHRLRNAAFVWDATFDDVTRFMALVPAGDRVVWHIHPLYIDFASD